ncbi:MAG TPA: exodeoxyribonuclease VII large subunit [Pirellulales bacterium]|jgi:exodeoxyribonuclease VII large subunit|nr:exodeoxyribonuclease VII large subunit [Pirellulales bacterium]
MDAFPPSAPNQVVTVSQLTAALKEVLEGCFPSVWVAGEISNFSRPQSGHCYLTLKDSDAQIRAVIWRSAAARVRFDLHDGLEVLCRGAIDLYAPRGSYQLVIQEIEPRGIGALELALRKLREKLAAEGLFHSDRKRALPPFPRHVAFVTSPTGAAIRDFLEVARRRWQGVRISVVPVRVQGDGAAAEIAAAIVQVNRWPQTPDVLVVGRGGGSLEDLWAFNEEIVVRAIHASRIPTVSAVGHEIDVTLADLVADLRAATPTEAAERIVPALEDLLTGLRIHQKRMTVALQKRAATARAALDALSARRVFRKPFESLQNQARRLDEWAGRAERAVENLVAVQRQSLGAAAARLESLSPLSVLARGYSLTSSRAGTLLRRAADAQVGDQIVTRLARGQLTSRVEAIELAASLGPSRSPSGNDVADGGEPPTPEESDSSSTR